MSESNCAETGRVNQSGKNKEKVFCSFCPSKILNAEAATLVNTQFALPRMDSSKRNDESEVKELVGSCWLIEDMYSFENIGVSNTVENVKYLTCADCEKGPVGWHELSTRKSYIALSRVKHDA